MKVKEIMTRNIETATPQTTLKQAADMMKKHNIGALPVIADGALIGMVTDRDLVLRAMAEGRDPLMTNVADTMSPEVICCFEDQDVSEAVKLMQQKKLRRLPVVDRNTKPVGIVALGDVALRIKDEKVAGRVLQQVSM